MALNVGELFVQLNGNNKNLNKALTQSQKLVDATAKKISAASNIAKTSFALMGTGAALATKNFADFEKQMSRVNTIINVNRNTLDDFSKDVIKISNDSGKAAKELATALFDVTSSGVKTSKSIDVLALSTKAAIAGFTRVDLAVKAGISTVNSYGLEVTDLKKVFDLQFSTVKKGILTYEQLGNSLGMLLPSSSKLGVSLEETFGGLAFLTQQGQSAEAASTALARSFDGLVDKSEALKSMGINVFDATGKFAGLENIIGQLAAQMQGLTDEEKNATLEMIGFDIRATRAIVPAINNFGKFSEVIGDVSDSAGIMEEAYTNATDNIDFEFNKLMRSITNTSKLGFLEVAENIKEPLALISKALSTIDFEEVFGSDVAKRVGLVAVGFLGVTGALAGIGIAISLLTNPFAQVVLASALAAKAVEENFLNLGGVFTWFGDQINIIAKGLAILSNSFKQIQIDKSLDKTVKALQAIEGAEFGEVISTGTYNSESGEFDFKEQRTRIISKKDLKLLENANKELKEMGINIDASLGKAQEEFNRMGVIGESTQNELVRDIGNAYDQLGLKQQELSGDLINIIKAPDGSEFNDAVTVIVDNAIGLFLDGFETIGEQVVTILENAGVKISESLKKQIEDALIEEIIAEPKVTIQPIIQSQSDFMLQSMEEARSASYNLPSSYTIPNMDADSLDYDLTGLSEALGTTADDFASAVGDALSNSTIYSFGDNLENAVFENVKAGLINAFLEQQAFDVLSEMITKALADGKLSMKEQLEIKFEVKGIKAKGKDFLELINSLGLGLEKTAVPLDDFKTAIDEMSKSSGTEAQDALDAVANSMSEVASETGKLGSLLENDFISSISSVISELSNIQSITGVFGANNPLAGLVPGLSVFTSAVSIFSGIAGLFGSSTDTQMTASEKFEEAVNAFKAPDGSGVAVLDQTIQENMSMYNEFFETLDLIGTKVGEVLGSDYIEGSAKEAFEETGNAFGKEDSFYFEPYTQEQYDAYVASGFGDTIDLVGFIEELEAIDVAISEDMSTMADTFKTGERDIASAVGTALASSNLEDFSKNLKDSVYDSIKTGMINAFLATESFQDLSDILTLALVDAEISDLEMEDIEAQMAIIETSGKVFLKAMEAAGLITEDIAESTEDIAESINEMAENLAASISSALAQSTVDTFGDNLEEAVFDNVKNGLIKAFMQKQEFEDLANSITEAISDGLTLGEKEDIMSQISDIQSEGEAFLSILEQLGLGFEGLDDSTNDLSDTIEALSSNVKTAAIRQEVENTIITRPEPSRNNPDLYALPEFDPIAVDLIPNPITINPTAIDLIPNPIVFDPTEIDLIPNPFTINPIAIDLIPNPITINPIAVDLIPNAIASSENTGDSLSGVNITISVGDVIDRELLITEIKNGVGTAIATAENRLYGTGGGVIV